MLLRYYCAITALLLRYYCTITFIVLRVLRNITFNNVFMGKMLSLYQLKKS